MALFNNRKVFVFVLLLAGFIGFLVAGLQSGNFGPSQQPVVRQLPSIPVTLLASGSVVHSDTLLGQDFQLVNVWASWCGVCKAEHAFLNQLASAGVPIIGLNYRDKKAAAQNYLALGGDPYQHIMFDPKGQFGIELGVVGTPETYVVNREGEIVYKHFGLLNQTSWDARFAQYFSQEVDNHDS
ncbi:DsbE family thiol:disulfide interchange protein [Vibrio sp. 16]|uniref:DsbE family thiol:disulfide interchange protein n=1 Tax=Vibrio sp. 16 TaxID=391586 RepID=UPI002FF26B39